MGVIVSDMSFREAQVLSGPDSRNQQVIIASLQSGAYLAAGYRPVKQHEIK